MNNRYVVVSGVVFGLVASAQLIRAVTQMPAHVGSMEIPVWVSWVAAIVAGSLCIWAFSSRR